MKPFQLVFRYARKYTGTLIITVISMFLLVGVQLLIPWIIKILISAITDQMAASQTMTFITSLTLAVLGIYVLRAVLQVLRGYLAHVAGWGVVAEVRGHIYNHLQRLSLRYYADKQTGQLMSRIVNDTDLFEQLIAHAVPDVLVNILTLVGSQHRPFQPELAADPTKHHSYSFGDSFLASICSLCQTSFPGPATGTGGFECVAQ